MHTQVFVEAAASAHSAAAIATRDRERVHSLFATLLSPPLDSNDAAYAADELRRTAVAYRDALLRPPPVVIATPSFDDCPSTCLNAASSRVGSTASVQRRRSEGVGNPTPSRVPLACAIEETVLVPPPPRRPLMRVRYTAQHGPVAPRARLHTSSGTVLRPTQQRSKDGKTRHDRSAGGLQRRRGGSARMEPYLSCIISNTMPQSAPSVELPPAMLLLRVTLNHLRTVGALPYILDVAYERRYARLTLSPQQMHPQFGSIPVTSVKIYAVLGQVKALGDVRLLRFSGCAEAEEQDIVLAFAFDSERVDDNPWEPAFVERECRYRFYTGAAVSGPMGSILSSRDWERHRTAISVDDSTLFTTHEEGKTWHGKLAKKLRMGSVGEAGLPFSREIMNLQQSFTPFDACHSELSRHGFAGELSWLAVAARLNTAVFIAVHRVWYILRHREELGPDAGRGRPRFVGPPTATMQGGIATV